MPIKIAGIKTSASQSYSMNKKKTTLRGLVTISFFADDLQEAKKWHIEFLGIELYYFFPDQKNRAYMEFRIGDYEHDLGIIDKKYQPKLASGKTRGAVVFWHVDDIKDTFDKLVEMGATEYEKITEREDGFITASVIDSFGNTLGIMCNPHYF